MIGRPAAGHVTSDANGKSILETRRNAEPSKNETSRNEIESNPIVELVKEKKKKKNVASFFLFFFYISENRLPVSK